MAGVNKYSAGCSCCGPTPDPTKTCGVCRLAWPNTLHVSGPLGTFEIVRSGTFHTTISAALGDPSGNYCVYITLSCWSDTAIRLVISFSYMNSPLCGSGLDCESLATPYTTRIAQAFLSPGFMFDPCPAIDFSFSITDLPTTCFDLSGTWTVTP